MVLFARPELYNLLFSRIPSHKIHMSKKLESFGQDHVGVRVQFADGSTVQSDILVGADGAYSGVRKHPRQSKSTPSSRLAEYEQGVHLSHRSH